MDTIARYEKRGTLTTYDITTQEYTEHFGWFMLREDGRTVTRRKINSRTSYLFCNVHDVYLFMEKK
jgi:hypothetical protein